MPLSMRAGTYTARIEASNENGSVTHTITYTIEKSSGTPIRVP